MNNVSKHHWLLASMMIAACSWVTHTTTANMSQVYQAQQTLEFVQLSHKSGQALNGGLPDSTFSSEFKWLSGPLSDITRAQQSPADYVFIDASEPLSETRYRIEYGDNLDFIFKSLDLNRGLINLINDDPVARQLTQLTIGRELVFKHNLDGELKELYYPVNSLQNLKVRFDNNSLTTELINLPFYLVERTISGIIDTSLYDAALQAGLSIGLIMEMVRIFGWDIDFVQDIREGDAFHVIYEENHVHGKKLSDGGIVAAEFTTQGNTFRAIRFTSEAGETSFYNSKGESMLGSFLRSPVEFSRISSKFGRRHHPILKRWKAHNGVDYAAKRGTPIRATADGKVIHAGAKGGYGNTVILQHADRFTTLYAHMHGYAKGVRKGSKVRQGQVIGYIGSTGLATGPHLHYEFRLDGVHRNPLTFKTPKASSVAEHEKALFDQIVVKQVDKLSYLRSSFAKNNASNR